MSMEQPPPEVLAFVVADHGYRDDVSGKLFLLGIRWFIGASTFPWHQPRLTVYVALVEGRGENVFQVRLIDVDQAREPVFVEEATVNFSDPITEHEVVFQLPDLVFPEPGEYRVELYADGRFLRERRLVLIPLENPGQL
jgi:hypothetical protein